MPKPSLQITPVAFVIVGVKVNVGLLEQTFWSGPMDIVGEGVKLKLKLSLTGLQVPLPVETKVKITLPPEISEAEGL